eukprot:Awhi_evm1s2656
MIFSQLLIASVIALSSAAPLTVNVSVNTCSSYFFNLNYECQHAGLVGAKDPNAVCPTKDCTLAFCCKFSVPQLTPPKPGQVPQLTPTVPQQTPPVPQKTPPVPQQTPPVPQKTPPVPQRTPPKPVVVVTANPPKTFSGFSPYYPPNNCKQFLKDHPAGFCKKLGYKDLNTEPLCANGCSYKDCCGAPIYTDYQWQHNARFKDQGRIVRVHADCQQVNRCFLIITGFNFENDCKLAINRPDNGDLIHFEVTKCKPHSLRMRLNPDIARNYGELLISLENIKSNEWSNTFPAIIHMGKH